MKRKPSENQDNMKLTFSEIDEFRQLIDLKMSMQLIQESLFSLYKQIAHKESYFWNNVRESHKLDLFNKSYKINPNTYQITEIIK